MFKQEELGYEYDALEPHIDAKTMEIHFTKHHAGYVAKLNAAVEGTEWESKEIQELVTKVKVLPDSIKTAVRNNGGGHYNHTLFWKLMKKDVKAEGPLVDAIVAKWGSLDKFKEEFSNAAATRFGSGWAWLVTSKDGLEIVSTANQDNPLTDGKFPLIGLDVWEHAYYLKYQNKRPDYIEAFFSVINWEYATERFKETK